jgi:hypothetical protein
MTWFRTTIPGARMLSDYRQRFSDYHSELNREDYLLRSGRKDRRETARIFSEYSDLFGSSVADELRAALKATPDLRATEQASIRRLIAFALEGSLAAAAREISNEIEEYESAARIAWDDREVSFQRSAELIGNETEATRRHELSARRSEVIDGAQDLRAERCEKLHATARELGFENYLAMQRELRGVDYDRLAAQARLLLSKTESGFFSALAPLLTRETQISIDEATPADLGFLQRFTRFDHFFSRERMMETYRELLAGFGFKTELQTNLEIDWAERPRKQSEAFSSPIRIPDEVKLVFTPTGGQRSYREFLREAGRSQNFAWTSRNLYPEFKIGGDASAAVAWGMLFKNLALDEHWLLGTFGFVENKGFRHALEVFRLLGARQAAAKLNYEVEFHSGLISGGAGARYAELMTDATHVNYHETERLFELSDSLRPAVFLRACCFESQMREYLKTQFGIRWWASRKAGETIIDLWNTGQRYTVEELAALIGLGELDFDWLAAELMGKIEK